MSTVVDISALGVKHRMATVVNINDLVLKIRWNILVLQSLGGKADLWSTELFSHFQSFEVVSHYRDPQFQMAEN